MIFGIDAQTAWFPIYNATSGGGVILKTSDGGVTWNPQSTAAFTAPAGFPNVVYFWNADTGFCMGDPNHGGFEIYTTVNGGTNWTIVALANIPAALSGEYGVTGYVTAVGSTAWFTTNKSKIYRSNDYGATWIVFTTPVPSDKQFKPVFRTLNDGIIKMNESPYTAWETHDGGANWTQISFFGNWYNSDFCYVPGTADTWACVGSDATTPLMGIAYSEDGGHNWTDFASMDTTQHLAIAFANNEIGWSGSFNNYGNDGMFKYHGTMFALDTCSTFAAGISQSATQVDLATSGQVDFTDISFPAANNWYWNFGDGGSAIPQNPSHTYTTVGTYPVMLTANHGVCFDTAYSQVIVVNTASINDIGIQVMVFPNPATNQIKIQGLPAGIFAAAIFSADGKLVMSSMISENSNIDVSNLSEGVYTIRLSNDEFIANKTLLIKK
jgi:photosystem II stability/assembly factor-like uncharacterized protein